MPGLGITVLSDISATVQVIDESPGLSFRIMKSDKRLLFGPLAAAILALGIVGLSFWVPGYSQVRQTVSEIGEMSSPARVPFTIMLCCVALCLLIFAAGVRAESKRTGRGLWSSYLIGCMAVSAAGVGVFAFPHPLHNVFGESELIGYQAPLAFALSWRADIKAKRLVAFSWIMFALIWMSIAVNLVSFDRHSALWAEMKPVYGLIQRSLFAAFFGWCAGIGLLLFRHRRTATGAPKVVPPTPD
jgi:hypothetical membrane protein